MEEFLSVMAEFTLSLRETLAEKHILRCTKLKSIIECNKAGHINEDELQGDDEDDDFARNLQQLCLSFFL